MAPDDKPETAHEHAVRALIEGRVQGVGYRAWTGRNARVLGLRGWVRNRLDGSVEALFAGPPGAVREMVQRCHDGPRSAEVASVTCEAASPDVEPGFRLLPDA
jgi:acylphosphatase